MSKPDSSGPEGFQHELRLAQPVLQDFWAWLLVLVGPVAFLADQSLSYYLVHPLCEAKQPLPLFLIPLGSASLTTIAGAIAWRRYTRSGGSKQGEQVTSFLARFGLLLSSFSVLAIVAMAIPRFILGPCDR
jgi:hypothetical protein